MWWLLRQSIPLSDLLAIDLSLWYLPFYYLLIQNGCGTFLGIGLTTELGANNVLHMSKIPLHQVLTHPWILYIAGCPVQVHIRLSVAGICCSVAWANPIFWVIGKRLGWWWWRKRFFVGPYWAIGTDIFWVGCQYHFVAAVPQVFEIYSGIRT